MVSSILLLLALQYLWLQKVYDDGLENIQKESNQLLRNSIRSLQDSIIQRNIIPLDENSEATSAPGMRFRFRNFTDSTSRTLAFRDSIRSIEVNRASQTVAITFQGRQGSDSLRSIIASPIRSYMENDPGMRSFFLRTVNDSLKQEDISKKFAAALHEAELNLNFELKKLKRGTDYQAENPGILASDPVPVGPFDMWVAYFPNPDQKILADMLPQFLFCLVLSLITIGSFYIMHKNLSAQQQLMQIKNEFISNMTHELKTPVATVSVALEAIRNFNVMDKPELKNEYLDMAQNELNRLSLMTDKVLKTALFEERGIVVDKEDFDLAALVEEILPAMKLVFEKQSAKVQFNKTGSNFHLIGSKIHLSNVIYNLLDNALKYSGSGVHIDIEIIQEANHLTIIVSDTGPGISTEYHKKVFEKFFRVPSGDVHNIKGYGLGLSYVNSVIEEHGGNIKLESALGKGSRFIINLPVNRV